MICARTQVLVPFDKKARANHKQLRTSLYGMEAEDTSNVSKVRMCQGCRCLHLCSTCALFPGPSYGVARGDARMALSAALLTAHPADAAGAGDCVPAAGGKLRRSSLGVPGGPGCRWRTELPGAARARASYSPSAAVCGVPHGRHGLGSGAPALRHLQDARAGVQGAHPYACARVCMYGAHVCVCMHACMRAYMHGAPVCVCMYACMHASMYARAFARTHPHAHTHTPTPTRPRPHAHTGHMPRRASTREHEQFQTQTQTLHPTPYTLHPTPYTLTPKKGTFRDV